MRYATARSFLTVLLLPVLVNAMAQGTISHAPHHDPSVPPKGGDRIQLNQYCAPTYTVGPADGDLVNGVQFGTINYPFSGDNGGTGYTDLSYEGTSFATELVAGNSYFLNLTSGSYQPPNGSFEYYKVWIDFDHDLQFEATEEVLNAQINIPNYSFGVSVDIPLDAAAGYTGMRVRNVYNDGSFTACSSHNYGETEDYTVLIQNGLPCIPLSSFGGHDGDYTSAVSVGDLLYTQPAAPVHGYTSRMDLGTHLRRGTTNALQLVSGPYASDHFGVWADWNHDGDFDDADELVEYAQITAAFTPFNTMLNVPDHAAVGYTVLRVRCLDDAFGLPCSGINYGSTVDFTVSVSTEAYPCLPISGVGTVYGDGFSTCTVPGLAVFLGTEEWPFYQLSSVPLHFEQGEATVLNLITGNYAPERYVVSMDMNDDGDFDDAGEELVTGQSTVAFQSLQLFYTVPLGCPPGQHVVRLRAFDPNNGPAEPCGAADYGEVLDIPIAVNVPNGPCMPFAGNVNLWGVLQTFTDGVQLGDISNTGSGGSYTAPYKDYTALSTTLTINQTYDLTITSGLGQFDVFSAWIDYNADGDWDDAGEQIGNIPSIPTSFTDAIMTFTVPAVTLGDKVMRVRSRGGGAPSPCSDAEFGETEDYTVTIETNTGIGEQLSSTWSVFAQPAQGTITVRASSDVTNTTYRMVDALGREVGTGRIAGPVTELNGTALATGSYLLLVEGDDTREVLRFNWVR